VCIIDKHSRNRINIASYTMAHDCSDQIWINRAVKFFLNIRVDSSNISKVRVQRLLATRNTVVICLHSRDCSWHYPQAFHEAFLFPTLTLKPLYHSFMVASSYRVCDLRKSMSSLLNLSLLPKQPILISATIDKAFRKGDCQSEHCLKIRIVRSRWSIFNFVCTCRAIE